MEETDVLLMDTGIKEPRTGGGGGGGNINLTGGGGGGGLESSTDDARGCVGSPTGGSGGGHGGIGGEGAFLEVTMFTGAVSSICPRANKRRVTWRQFL